jgi:hypothetical protein
VGVSEPGADVLMGSSRDKMLPLEREGRGGEGELVGGASFAGNLRREEGKVRESCGYSGRAIPGTGTGEGRSSWPARSVGAPLPSGMAWHGAAPDIAPASCNGGV